MELLFFIDAPSANLKTQKSSLNEQKVVFRTWIAKWWCILSLRSFCVAEEVTRHKSDTKIMIRTSLSQSIGYLILWKALSNVKEILSHQQPSKPSYLLRWQYQIETLHSPYNFRSNRGKTRSSPAAESMSRPSDDSFFGTRVLVHQQGSQVGLILDRRSMNHQSGLVLSAYTGAPC